MEIIVIVILFALALFAVLANIFLPGSRSTPSWHQMSDKELFKLDENDLEKWDISSLKELLDYAEYQCYGVGRFDTKDYDFRLSLKWGQLYRRAFYALNGYYPE